MKDEIQMVKDTYNADVVKEWERLILHPVEFDITRKYIDRYIKPGGSRHWWWTGTIFSLSCGKRLQRYVVGFV